MSSFVRYSFIACATFVAVVYAAQAQPARKWSFGLFGSYNMNSHSVDFPEFPTVPIFSSSARADGVGPANFSNVSNSAAGYGLLLEYAASPELAIGLRMGLQPQTVDLKTSYSYLVGRKDGTSDNALSEYALSAKLGGIALGLNGAYKVWQDLSVKAGVTARFASGTFTQKETLAAPSDGTFETGTRERNSTPEKDIPDLVSPALSVWAGLGYDYPLSDRLALAPEIAYSLGLTKVVKDLSWNLNALSFGVAVKMKL